MGDMFEIVPLRCDFYFLPGQDLEGCMKHYREEKSSRAQQNSPLQLIDAYNRWHQSFLVLVDNENWRTEGVKVAHFDPWPAEDPDPTLEDIRIRKGIMVKRRPQSTPGGLYSLSDIFHDLKFEPLFDPSQEPYDQALKEGRSIWT